MTNERTSRGWRTTLALGAASPCVALLFASWVMWRHAQGRAAIAMEIAAQTSAIAREIDDLRAELSQRDVPVEARAALREFGVRARALSAAALPAHLTRVMAVAGLPAGALVGLQSSPSARPGATVLTTATQSTAAIGRERASVTFSPVTFAQLGRFLASWLEAEPAWVVTSIDLTPIGPMAGDAARGAANAAVGGPPHGATGAPLRVVLVMERVEVIDIAPGGRP